MGTGEGCNFGIRIRILEEVGTDSFEENAGVHLKNVSNAGREVEDVLERMELFLNVVEIYSSRQTVCTMTRVTWYGSQLDEGLLSSMYP